MLNSVFFHKRKCVSHLKLKTTFKNDQYGYLIHHWLFKGLLLRIGHTAITKLRHQSPRNKKIGKIRLGSTLSLGLIYGLRFGIQAASYFPQSCVQITGLIFYLADFHVWNWCIQGFEQNKTNILSLFTKTNHRFYFRWA